MTGASWGGWYPAGGLPEVMRIASGGWRGSCGTIVSLNGVYELLPLNLTVCRGCFNRMTQAL